VHHDRPGHFYDARRRRTDRGIDLDRQPGRDLPAGKATDKQEVVAVNNADKIRKENNLDLALWLSDHMRCETCPAKSANCVCCWQYCARSLKAWLEREVPENAKPQTR